MICSVGFVTIYWVRVDLSISEIQIVVDPTADRNILPEFVATRDPTDR